MPETNKSTILVVIGITGDLSHRYLLPSLVEVDKAGKLPEDFVLLGISRREVSAAEIFPDSLAGSKIASKLQMLKMNLEEPADYQQLAKRIQKLGKEQVIFYFAVPPDAVQGIITNLGNAGLNTPNIKLPCC